MLNQQSNTHKILAAARHLYSADAAEAHTIEKLAKDTDVDAEIFKGLEEGIDMYIHPLKRKSPDKIAEHLKEKYKVMPGITYRLLLDLTEKGLKAYQMYRKRRICSRRIAANAAGLDGFIFEDFFWSQGLSDQESQKKPECEKKLQKQIKEMRKTIDYAYTPIHVSLWQVKS